MVDGSICGGLFNIDAFFGSVMDVIVRYDEVRNPYNGQRFMSAKMKFAALVPPTELCPTNIEIRYCKR